MLTSISTIAQLKTTQWGGAVQVYGRRHYRLVAQQGVTSTGKRRPTSMNSEPRKTKREVPLVLLGGTDPVALQALARLLRQEGMGVAGALGDRACLRVATALGPDIILLDPRLPRALLNLLRAHPLSKSAHISWSQALARPATVAT
jgi:hypothetical protein